MKSRFSVFIGWRGVSAPQTRRRKGGSMGRARREEPATELVAVHRIERSILWIRGQRVMLDADLAFLYGVPTKVLNQAVRRNRERFPKDFMFRLTRREKGKVVTDCDHLAGMKFSAVLPFAFSEHGA